MKRHGFNMIEIVLALGVAGIGIAGVMGILPVAINASKNAVADSYVADIANTFFSFIEVTVKKEVNWASFPVEKTAHPQLPEHVPVDAWSNVVTGMDGLYDLGNGIYGAKMGDSFAAHVAVWSSPIDDFSVGTTKNTLPTGFARRVYVEISWPVTAAYAKREKRIYVREFFNAKYVEPEPGP